MTAKSKTRSRIVADGLISNVPYVHRNRICLVVSGPNEYGGIERHVVDLANGLSQRFEVHVIADSSFAGHFDAEVVLHEVPFTRSRFSPRLLLSVSKVLRTVAPNLVHVHGAKAARILTLVGRKRRTPRVLTVHNTNPIQRLCEKFDRVITVTSSINSLIVHPLVVTILNGRG